MGPWTDIYAIGACIYACMQGLCPTKRRSASKRPPSLALTKLRGVYSDNLIEGGMVHGAGPAPAPQSVFALPKELSREGERRYTKLTVAEKMRCSWTPGV